MDLQDLKCEYDRLQLEFGDANLDSIYNGGWESDADVMFVFMNPTGRNIASDKNWKGLKAPWIGTKNIWDLFLAVGLFDKDLYDEIKSKKGSEWTPEFAEEVYEELRRHKVFVTNLGKCTQVDARPLPDYVYKEYLDLLKREITIVNPKVIILFGNQVSSIVLDEKVSVSSVRKKSFDKIVDGKNYRFYSVYYPIGNGRFNISKSIEDIEWILENEVKASEVLWYT